MEPNDMVLEFLRKLVTEVRDESIEQLDVLLRPDANGVSAKHWRSLGVVDGPAARSIITKSVHCTLHALLTALVEGRMHLTYVADSGQAVDIGKVGSDWIQMVYSSGDEGLEDLAKQEWVR